MSSDAANHAVEAPEKAFKAPKTALWSDAFHHVRPAGPKDKHPMRFVVASHDKRATMGRRHVMSLEDGIASCERATKLLEKALGVKPPEAAVKPKASRRKRAVPVSPQVVAEPKPAKLPEMSIVRFDCFYANSVAQAWVCRRPPGKKKPMPHKEGQGMCVIRGEPVREDDGSIKVYGNPYEAEEEAYNAFLAADEDERWKDGRSPEVEAYYSCHILHSVKDTESVSMPFCIWIVRPEWSRWWYSDDTHAVIGVGGASDTQLRNAGWTEDAIAEVHKGRKKWRDFYRAPSFNTKPKSFRTIDDAMKDAMHIMKRWWPGELIDL